MNENLNLVEILKDCPKGTKLYSIIFGEVKFDKIEEDHEYPIIFTINNGEVTIPVASDGRHLLDFNGDCTLFPSRNQRDWSKFKHKNPKFDPKTLKSFDKVLVRDDHNQKWECNLFSYINIIDDIYYPYVTIINTGYRYCIPYNEDTKHLVGTTEEVPEFYRYWED